MDMVLNPKISEIRAFLPASVEKLLSLIFTVLGVRNLLVLTSDQLFSPPKDPVELRPLFSVLRQKMKGTEQA